MTTDDTGGGSSPCFAHHLVDGHPVDPETARDVARFRRARRARLIAARDLPPGERAEATAALTEALDRLIAPAPGMAIAAYWPIRGEPDLRPWMAAAHAAGARILLPVVVEDRAPLDFRAWSPDGPMARDAAKLRVPAGGEAASPDLVLAPLVGVDEALHRLGYGEGFYDRTLSRLEPRPRVVGVGFAGTLLPTIYPMPWDEPMDEVLLSDGTWLRR